MKNLVIIGARNFGREIFSCADQCKGYNTEWSIKGFLDDNNDALKDYSISAPVLNSVESYKVMPGDVFVCALGDVNYKAKYIKIIKEKGGEFLSLIHKTAIIHRGTKHGEGLIMFPYSLITCDVSIGNFVSILPFSVLGHDVKVGDYCHINSNSSLGGFVKVGDLTTINTGASIVPGVQIGNNAVIGAGSVVIKDVPDNCTVFGCPARNISLAKDLVEKK